MNILSGKNLLILKRVFIFFGVFASFQTVLFSQKLEGHIHLDSIWQPKIYLSHIPSFAKMNTMSKDMIIAETVVDSNGFFTLNTDFLPSENNLYRIHISKMGGPVASLIIGGEEHNHFFIIANNQSNIQIKNEAGNGIFKNLKISGYKPSEDFHKIDLIAKNIDSAYSMAQTIVKREFITKAIEEKLRYVADTCTSPLPSLYALYKSNYGKNVPVNQQFYERYLEKWKTEDSPYFKEVKSKITPSISSKIKFYPYAIIGFTFFIFGMITKHFISKRQNTKQNGLNQLSVQERRILSAIQSGKSNKEIAEEFNIGLSTVKSHVSHIYSKLGVKSRKEVINTATE